MADNDKKFWIQAATEHHKGLLRKKLKAKEGKNIPMAKLDAAAKKPGALGKEARLAKTLKKLHKK